MERENISQQEFESGQAGNNILASGTTRDRSSSLWFGRILVLVAGVLQFARIMGIESTTGEVPFQSANDRSRWCTIAALAITGSYEIDSFLEIRDPKTKRRTWYTIDLVRHRGKDGVQHFYSSKPPLLPTIYTGVYVAVRAATGATLMNDPFFVVRLMLVICNLLPLVLFWWLSIHWLHKRLQNDWSFFLFVVFLVFGTYLSTFVVTLNNHLPAALAVGVSVFCLDKILIDSDDRWRWFILAGLATSFAASNELPALSWVAAVGAMLIIYKPTRGLLGYLPALLPIVFAFFAANYAAHGELAPAYAHRGLGVPLVQMSVSEEVSVDELDPEDVAAALRESGEVIEGESIIQSARREGVWEFWNPETQQRFGLSRAGEKSGELWVYAWGDWYDYPNSYWTSDRKQGVDRGEANRMTYIFHCLLGHHGIISLTPFWIISLVGVGVIYWKRETVNIFREYRLLIACAFMATTIVSVSFYLARPLEDRNYGGVTSGFRWSFWLIPLWCWLAVYGLKAFGDSSAGDSIDSARSKLHLFWWAKRLVEVLVLISIFSASYPWENPWTSPWLMQYWQYLQWVPT